MMGVGGSQVIGHEDGALTDMIIALIRRDMRAYLYSHLSALCGWPFENQV